MKRIEPKSEIDVNPFIDLSALIADLRKETRAENMVCRGKHCPHPRLQRMQVSGRYPRGMSLALPMKNITLPKIQLNKRDFYVNFLPTLNNFVAARTSAFRGYNKLLDHLKSVGTAAIKDIVSRYTKSFNHIMGASLTSDELGHHLDKLNDAVNISKFSINDFIDGQLQQVQALFKNIGYAEMVPHLEEDLRLALYKEAHAVDSLLQMNNDLPIKVNTIYLEAVGIISLKPETENSA